MMTLLRLLPAAVAAAAGGWLASRLGLPLAWLIGAALVTVIISLSTAPVIVPRYLYRAGLVVVGVAVGLKVTADVAGRLGLHVYIIPLAALLSIAIGRALTPLLARFGCLDRTTAYFSLVPAGISEMADLAGRHGGDVGAVATLHALRVLLIVLVMPVVIFSFNRADFSLPLASGDAWTIALGASLVIGATAAWLMSKAGMPSAFIVAPMVVIAILSGSGILLAQDPPILIAGAQIVLGLNLGARFRRQTVRRLPRALAAGAPLMAIHAAILGLVAVVLARAFDFKPAVMILGLATGGTAEMVLTAATAAADATLVAAYQVTRGLLGNLLAGVIYETTVADRSPPPGKV